MYKLLIVDDEDIVREGLRDLIGHLQIPHIGPVLTARDGETALALIAEENPSIVLTDLNMPGMGGLELIKSLYGHSPLKVIVVSGYDDFHLVKESFKHGVRDYLLKPAHSEELRELLDKVARELQLEENRHREGESDKVLARLERISRSMNWAAQSGEQDNESFERVFAELGFRLPFPLTAVALLSPFRMKGDAEASVAALDAARSVEGDSDTTGMKLYPFHTRDNDLAVWINYDGNRTGEEAIVQKLLPFLTAPDGASRIIALGRSVEGTSRLGEAYRSALGLLPYRLTFGQPALITPSALSDLRDLALDANDRRVLAEMVEMGRKEHVSSFIQKYFNDASLKASTLAGVFATYDDVLKTIGWVSGQKRDFASFQHSEQLRLYLISCLLQTIEARQSLLRSGDMVEVAKKYVDDHLLGDINMAVIANQCNVSYTYFSKLFKENTGENFQDYVTAKRMEYARKALDGVNVKIYDVAAALGYSNPKNFTRVFKNYCGISPKEYQQRSK